MKRYHLALAALFLAVAPVSADAATLIDTGAPTSGPAASLFGFDGRFVQFLAGVVDFSQSVVVQSAHLYGEGSGLMRLSIYSFVDPGNGPEGLIPTGTPVFSSSYSDEQEPFLIGVSGLNVSLAAGKYWFAFEPADAGAGGFSGSAGSGVPNPLEEYAFTNEIPTVGTWHNGTPGNSFGMLIEGVSAVPEPASWMLMLGGIGMAGGMMRRRRATAAVRCA